VRESSTEDQQLCETCEGRGTVVVPEPDGADFPYCWDVWLCDECGGSGVVAEKEKRMSELV